MIQTLKDFRRPSNDLSTKLSDKDFDFLYSELVSFVRREVTNPSVSTLYAYLAGAYPMLPVDIAFEVVYRIRSDMFMSRFEAENDYR